MEQLLCIICDRPVLRSVMMSHIAEELNYYRYRCKTCAFKTTHSHAIIEHELDMGHIISTDKPHRYLERLCTIVYSDCILQAKNGVDAVFERNFQPVTNSTSGHDLTAVEISSSGLANSNEAHNATDETDEATRVSSTHSRSRARRTLTPRSSTTCADDCLLQMSTKSENSSTPAKCSKSTSDARRKPTTNNKNVAEKSDADNRRAENNNGALAESAATTTRTLYSALNDVDADLNEVCGSRITITTVNCAKCSELMPNCYRAHKEHVIKCHEAGSDAAHESEENTLQVSHLIRVCFPGAVAFSDYQCAICGHVVRSRSGRRHHMCRQHYYDILDCPSRQCLMKFSQLESLSAHIRNAHRDSNALNDAEEMEFRCIKDKYNRVMRELSGRCFPYPIPTSASTSVADALLALPSPFDAPDTESGASPKITGESGSRAARDNTTSSNNYVNGSEKTSNGSDKASKQSGLAGINRQVSEEQTRGADDEIGNATSESGKKQKITTSDSSGQLPTAQSLPNAHRNSNSGTTNAPKRANRRPTAASAPDDSTTSSSSSSELLPVRSAAKNKRYPIPQVVPIKTEIKEEKDELGNPIVAKRKPTPSSAKKNESTRVRGNSSSSTDSSASDDAKRAERRRRIGEIVDQVRYKEAQRQRRDGLLPPMRIRPQSSQALPTAVPTTSTKRQRPHSSSSSTSSTSSSDCGPMSVARRPNATTAGSSVSRPQMQNDKSNGKEVRSGGQLPVPADPSQNARDNDRAGLKSEQIHHHQPQQKHKQVDDGRDSRGSDERKQNDSQSSSMHFAPYGNAKGRRDETLRRTGPPPAKIKAGPPPRSPASLSRAGPPVGTGTPDANYPSAASRKERRRQKRAFQGRQRDQIKPDSMPKLTPPTSTKRERREAAKRSKQLKIMTPPSLLQHPIPRPPPQPEFRDLFSLPASIPPLAGLTDRVRQAMAAVNTSSAFNIPSTSNPRFYLNASMAPSIYSNIINVLNANNSSSTGDGGGGYFFRNNVETITKSSTIRRAQAHPPSNMTPDSK